MFRPAFLIKFTVYRFLDALALRRAFDARSPVYRCFARKEPFVFMREIMMSDVRGKMSEVISISASLLVLPLPSAYSVQSGSRTISSRILLLPHLSKDAQ